MSCNTDRFASKLNSVYELTGARPNTVFLRVFLSATKSMPSVRWMMLFNGCNWQTAILVVVLVTSLESLHVSADNSAERQVNKHCDKSKVLACDNITNVGTKL